MTVSLDGTSLAIAQTLGNHCASVLNHEHDGCIQSIQSGNLELCMPSLYQLSNVRNCLGNIGDGHLEAIGSVDTE